MFDPREHAALFTVSTAAKELLRIDDLPRPASIPSQSVQCLFKHQD
jgi:hypothetical protein